MTASGREGPPALFEDPAIQLSPTAATAGVGALSMVFINQQRDRARLGLAD
ncbi:hypothetical protein ACFWOT_29435 [Streptomyces sp. NPDC058440]|uniref:hypothetical protein n=1 Tax=Streptomyces sp. NPDC058440 TaxID=3346501 RepID=UPI003649E774